MSGKIIRKTKNFEKLIKKIQKLQKAEAESGYFKEQGSHPVSDITYSGLAMLLEIKHKNVRKPTLFKMESPNFTGYLGKGLSLYLYGNVPLESILDDIGGSMSDIATSFFGRTSSTVSANSQEWASRTGDKSPAGANTPMIFDGHLVDAWSYRTSENKLIRR
tara:strand:+ start:189 stop:674 length:486 start_codon:yes stop_codon:yes gene_type:complete